MSDTEKKDPLTMQECAENLIRQAESMRHDGSEAMRFTQAAVNITNAMMNLKALEPATKPPLTASRSE